MTIPASKKELQTALLSIYEEREASAIAEWGIEWLTGMKRTDRLIGKDQPLSTEQLEKFKSLKEQLLQHEPIQYITGEAWFFGMKFKVSPAVLIPRPETEELVEWIISNCRFPINELKILDIGSGSGCIAVSLKRKLRKATVSSCDISPEALKIARENALALGADVEFIELDFLDDRARESLGTYDVIVSNPPYVAELEKNELRPNVLNYEPATALFVPDNDPAVFYKAIAAFGKTHLANEGSIYVEIPEDKGPLMLQVFKDQDYPAELKKDLQGKDRMIRTIF